MKLRQNRSAFPFAVEVAAGDLLVDCVAANKTPVIMGRYDREIAIAVGQAQLTREARQNILTFVVGGPRSLGAKNVNPCHRRCNRQIG